jgi:hypothetical protein
MVIALIVACVFIPTGIIVALFTHNILYWSTKESTKLFLKVIPDVMEYFGLDEESVLRLTEKSWITKFLAWWLRIFGVLLTAASVFMLLLILFSTK